MNMRTKIFSAVLACFLITGWLSSSAHAQDKAEAATEEEIKAR